MSYPTWGFHASEPNRIFDLEVEGGDLPEGWFDSPAKIGADPEPMHLIHQLSRGNDKGKFVVKLGDKVVAGPYETDAEAKAFLGGADGTPTPVPEAWEALTDDELIDLAAKLAGEPVNAGSEGSAADKARSIIQATVDDRASKAAA